MRLKNSSSHYSPLSIFLHWLIAISVIGQFAVGLYMTDLNYHDPLYVTLPHLHESFGILLAVAILLRIIWSAINIKPTPAAGVAAWEHRLSIIIQRLMQLLLVAIVSAGYLISTAEGDAISVFNWFELPALPTGGRADEDTAAFWHYWLACTLISCAMLHALGALKHHLFDRDETLRRMLGLKPKS